MATNNKNNQNNQSSTGDKYINYYRGKNSIIIDDKKFEGMQKAFQEALNNQLDYMTVQMQDGIKNYTAKIPLNFKKGMEKKLENLYINTVDVISQNLEDGLDKMITSYSQNGSKTQGFTRSKTETPIGTIKSKNPISATNLKHYAKNPVFSPDVVKQVNNIQDYVDATEKNLQATFSIAQSNYESINSYNSKMSQEIINNFKSIQGMTKKFSDNLIVHDTETIGKNRTIAQYSARYGDKEFSQIMKLQEDDISYLNELYNKASKNMTLTKDELRNLLYATDYTSNNGHVIAKHKNYDYKNVKMTEDLLSKIRAGIDILDPQSKNKYSGIASQKEGAINFNNWLKSLNLGNDLPTFMGTNTHGFDDPIVKRWMKTIWNGTNNSFNVKDLKSFDMLDYIKQMFPRGIKNKSGDMLLSNRLEKIAEFVGINLKDFAQRNEGTQHTGTYDTALTQETFDRLMSLVNNGDITPINKFNKAKQYSLSDLQSKHFVSGRTSFRQNELSFKTDKTGKKIIQDEFRDNFFTKGGVYSLLNLVEKNGQKYGVFQDQLSGQRNYVAYDQEAEIEALLNALSGGNFKENGDNNEALKTSIHNAAKYKMFNGRHASYFFDKFRELKKSQGKGYQESGYVTDIFNQLQDTKFIEDLDKILSKTNYEQLSYEGKSSVLNRIGGELGGKKFKTFTGNDIFKEIKSRSGSGMISGRMQKNFGEYIENLRTQGAFTKEGYETVKEAYNSIIKSGVSDFDLRAGDTSYNTLAGIISDSIDSKFLSKVSNPWFSVNTKNLSNNAMQANIEKYVEQAQAQFGTIKDGDTGVSRFITNLNNNGQKAAVEAIYGAHLPQLLKTLGKYDVATQIKKLGGKDYQLLSKDFGNLDKELNGNSLGGILKKIEKQASEWGLNTRFELNDEGDAIKLGFYDAYKNPFDEKGNYQWNQGFSTSIGLAQKDGTIRVGNQKKANFLNIYNDEQGGMTLQTLQEAQAVKVLNAFMHGSKLKDLALGENSDYEEATKYLSRVMNTALENAPINGSYASSSMEEADKSTNSGNLEQNITRMMKIQTKSFFQNKIRDYLKGQAQATAERKQHFEDVEYSQIEGMLNNRLQQVMQSLIMYASGEKGKNIALNTPEFKWIEKSGLINDIEAISQLGFKFGPSKEEAILNGIVGLAGSSTFDAFNVLNPDWHRAPEQVKNRAKMRMKDNSKFINGETVLNNIMGSDIGSALGINYNDESYGQMIFAETSDDIIKQAYQNVMQRRGMTPQEIENELHKTILPSVHNDSAIIKSSALKNRQVLSKTTNTLNIDDAKKYFKETLFSALDDKDSINGWDNIKEYVTQEGKKYLDNFQIDQMYFSDGQLIISKSRWDDLKSGFKGLGEHGSRKTWVELDDEIFEEAAILSGLGKTPEEVKEISGFYEKSKNSRKNAYQTVGGRYQYLLTKFFNQNNLSQDDKVAQFNKAIEKLPVLGKMLEWDSKNGKIQRKKDFDFSKISEDDLINFLNIDMFNKNSELYKLDEALFGSKGREFRNGRMAESLGQMEEPEWFSPTGTGGSRFSHTSMTKKGIDAMNRSMNFVKALAKGNSDIAQLQELMNHYYTPEQSEHLLKEERNIYDALAYFKSDKSKRSINDISENTDNLIITNDESKIGDNFLQLKDLVDEITYDKSGKVQNVEALALNKIKATLKEKFGDYAGHSVLLDLGGEHNFSWKDFYGNSHTLQAQNMQIPLTFDEDGNPADSTFALQRLMQAVYGGEKVDSNISAYLASLHKSVKGKEGRIHKSFNSKKLENTIALNTGGGNIWQTEDLNGYSVLNTQDLRDLLSVDSRADNAQDLYKQNNNNLQNIYKHLYGTEANIKQFDGLSGKKLEEALLNNIVKALTYENTEFHNDNGNTYRTFNGNDAGLAAFFDRYPFINGMDIQATKLLVSDKVSRGKMINSLGNILNAHGDYDGDKGYITTPWLSEYLNDEAFSKALSGFDNVHQFQKKIDKIQEDIFKKDFELMTPEQMKEFQKRMSSGEDVRKIAQDILNPTDEAIVTALAKTGKSSIGSLSNISTQIRNVMKDIGADANSLNLDSIDSVLNTISSLIVSGTTQSFEQDAISSKKVIDRLSKLHGGDKFEILSSLSNFADMLFSAKDFSKVSEEAKKMNIFTDEGASNDAVIKNSAIIKEIFDQSSSEVKQAIRSNFAGLFNENGEMDLTHFSIEDINKSFDRINGLVQKTFGDKYNLFAVKNFGKYKDHEEIYSPDETIKKVFGSVVNGISQDTQKQATEVNGESVNGFDLSKADVGQLTVGQIITNSIVSGNSTNGTLVNNAGISNGGILSPLGGNKNPILSSAIDVLMGKSVDNSVGNDGYYQDLLPFEQMILKNTQELKGINVLEAGPADLNEEGHIYQYQEGYAQKHGKNPGEDIRVDISTSKLANYYNGLPKDYKTSLSQLGYSNILDTFLKHVEENTLGDYSLRYLRKGSSSVFETDKGSIKNIYDLADIVGEKNLTQSVKTAKSSLYGTAAHSLLQYYADGKTNFEEINYDDWMNREDNLAVEKWMSKLQALSPNLNSEQIFKNIQTYAGQLDGIYSEFAKNLGISKEQLLKNNLREKSYYADFEIENQNGEKFVTRLGTTFDNLLTSMATLIDYKSGKLMPEKAQAQMGATYKVLQASDATTGLANYEIAAADLGLGTIKDFEFKVNDDAQEAYNKFVKMITDNGTSTVVGQQMGNVIGVTMSQLTDPQFVSMLEVATIDKIRNTNQEISGMLPIYNDLSNVSEQNFSAYKTALRQSLLGDKNGISAKDMETNLRTEGFEIGNFKNIDDNTISRTFKKLDEVTGQVIEFTAKYSGKIESAQDSTLIGYSDHQIRQHSKKDDMQYQKDAYLTTKENLETAKQLKEYYSNLLNRVNNDNKIVDENGNIVSDYQIEVWKKQAATYQSAEETARMDIAQMGLSDDVKKVYDETYDLEYKKRVDKDVETLKKSDNLNVFQGIYDSANNQLKEILKFQGDLNNLAKKIKTGKVEDTSKAQKNLEELKEQYDALIREFNKTIHSMDELLGENNVFSKDLNRQFTKIASQNDFYAGETNIKTGSEADKVASAYIQQMKQESDIRSRINKVKSQLVNERKTSEKYKAGTQEFQDLEAQLKDLQDYGIKKWQDESNRTLYSQAMRDFNGNIILDENGNPVWQNYSIGQKQQQQNQKEFKTAQQLQLKEAQQATKLAKPSLWNQFKAQWKGTMQYILMGQSAYMFIGKVQQAISQVIQLTKQLDQTMTNLMIVTGKSHSQVKDMVKDYSNLADELGGTTQEIAASANEWLRMGYTIDQTNTLIKNSMMLSKLGMIESEQATQYLISAIKGYGVAVEDSSKIVDMATALDMKYAVSSGYILEGMSKAAASAKLAKVEMADLQSMIAIVGETTQKSASSIGESFKTAFARYGNVKAGIFSGDVTITGEDGESYSDNSTTEGVNDIEKVLSKVGISLRESDLKTWRSYSDILKDIGKGWATYSDYEKNAITTAMFGTRQRENGLVVLSNYNRVLEANKVAISSVGTASKKYEAYQNSLEAATKRVSAAWEQLVLDLGEDGTLRDLSETLAFMLKHLKGVTLAALGLYAAFNFDKIIAGFAKMSVFLNGKTMGLASSMTKPFTNFSDFKGNLSTKWNNSLKEAQDIYNQPKTETDPVVQDIATHVSNIDAKIDGTNGTQNKGNENPQGTKSASSNSSGSNVEESNQKKIDASNSSDSNVEESNQNEVEQPPDKYKNWRQAALTGGTIFGTFGGMSLGGNLAEMAGLNSTMGSMLGMAIGGTIPSLVQQLAPHILGGFAGPVAGVVVAGLAGITSLVKNYHEQQLKIAKEALAKAEENYEAATKQETKDKITRYEELVQGVDENGKNVSLTTEDYQEFLDISNSLASIFPELVRQVDEYGNSLLGANGELNDANKEVGSIKEKIPEITNNLQKMADIKLLNDTVMKDDIGNRLKGVGWNKDSTYYDAQKKADKAEIKGSFLNYQLIKNSDNSGQIVGRGISADEISTILSSEAKNKVYIYENQDGTVFYQSKEDVSQEDFSEVIKELNQYVQTVNSRENVPYNNEANSYNQIAKQELQGVIQDYLPSILRQKSGYTVTDEQMKMALNIGQNLDTKSRGVITASNIEDKMDAIANLIVSDKNNNLEQMQEIDTNTMNYNEYQSKLQSNIDSYKKNIYDTQGNLTKDFIGLATGMGYKVDELQNNNIVDQIILKMSGLNENDLALTEQVYNKFRTNKNGFRNRNSVLSSIDLNQLTAGQLKQLYNLSDIQQDRFSTQLKEIGVSIENITKLLNELNPQNFYSMVSALEGLWEKSDEADFYSSWENWIDSFDDTDTLLNALSNLDETGFAKSYVEILKEQADNLNISLKDALKNYRALKDLDANGRSSKSVKTLVDDRENLLKIYKSIMTTNTLSSEDLETLKPIFSDIMTTVATKGKAGVAKEISDYLSVGNPETMFGSIKNQLDNENDFFNSVLKGTKDEQVLKYVKNKAEVDQIAKSAGYTAQTMHNFNPNQDFETTLKSMKKFYEDQGRTFEDNSQFIEWVLKEQFQVSTEDFNEAKKNAGIEDLLQKILSAIFGIDINSYEVNINQAAQQAYSQIDDAQFFSKEDKDKFKDDYKSLAKAKEEESKRQRDRAKELRNQAKEEREIERSKRDQINKEYLQALTDTMERRNLIIQEYDDKLNAVSKVQDVLDTADYGGKQISLQDQYDLTAKTVEEAKNQFAELANVMPHTSEEADKIASKMSELSGKIIEGEVSLHNLTKQMQENGFEALSYSIEKTNQQFENQKTILNNLQENLNNDNGLVDAWDLAFMATFSSSSKNEDEITSNREKYQTLLQMEEDYEKQFLAMRTKYLDLLKAENEEANALTWEDIQDKEEDLADTRADSALSAKWAEIEYQETLKNFEETHADILEGMGLDWQNFANLGVDSYKKLTQYLETNDIPIRFQTYINGQKIITDAQGNPISEEYSKALQKVKKNIGDVKNVGNDVYVVASEEEATKQGLQKHQDGLYYQKYTKEEWGKKQVDSPQAFGWFKPSTFMFNEQPINDSINNQKIILNKPELNYKGQNGWSDDGLIQTIKTTLTGDTKGNGVFPKVNKWLIEQHLLEHPNLQYDGDNGWGENGLFSLIQKNLQEAYTYATQNSSIKASEPDADSWTNFGQKIGEYISDGINNGIWDGEKRSALSLVGPVKGIDNSAGETLQNGGIPKGASVYFYSPYSNSGHVGIWDGNGKLYHNVGKDGKKGTIKHSSIADLEAQGYTYRGWGYNGGRQLSSEEADAMIQIAQNSKAYGINPIGGRCQAWVADVYAAATNTARQSAANAIEAGNKWIIGTNSTSTMPIFNNADNGLINLIINSLSKKGILQKDWDADQTTAAKYIYDYLSIQGFSNKAIAAILGNWQQESGLNPNKSQIGGTAYGLAQWDGGRKKALFDYAQSSTPTMLQQLEWFMSELKASEKKSMKILQNSDLSLDDMTVLFQQTFERAGKPNNKARMEYAQNWYSTISKYAEGTTKEGHKGGPALVGEGKNSEIVSIPNSDTFVVDKPTLIPNMPTGTQVMPIPEYAEGTGISLQDILKKLDDLNNTTQSIDDTFSKSVSDKKDLKDVKAIKELVDMVQNIDLLDSLNKLGRNTETLIQDDKLLRQLAFAKIDTWDISDEEKKAKKDNWDIAYKNLTQDISNPYYLTYVSNQFNKQAQESQEIFRGMIINARQNWSKSWENDLMNASSEIERQGLKKQQENSINYLELQRVQEQISIKQKEFDQVYNHLQWLKANNGDSELIQKAEEQLTSIYDAITNANKEYSETSNGILENLNTIYQAQKDDIDYQKTINTNKYDLGQMNDIENAFIQNRNDELKYNRRLLETLKSSAKDRENTIRQRGISQGLSEEQIKQEIENDSILRQTRQDINATLASNKEIVRSQFDNMWNKIERAISKLELSRPSEWTSRGQIGKFYSDLRQNYDTYISELEEYLRTAEDLTVEEQEEIFDKINQYKKNNLEAFINEYSDKVAYQEKVYSALQAQVNLYIDNLNEEKEAVDKRYDEEIKKLQQVNTDKERSIKLTELQQNLENAQNQKKRVYRAGVGFVYEADRNEVKKAKQSLDSFYREDRINDLNTAKSIEDDFYDKRIDGWNKYLKAIDKVYEKERRDQNQELLMKELHVNSLEELDNLLINDRDAYVLSYAQHYERWSDINFAYEGAWTPFLQEYETNLETLKKYQDMELDLLKEKIQTYQDSNFADINTKYSNPYYTGKIYQGQNKVLEDGSIMEIAPDEAGLGDIIKTKGGYFLIVPEGTAGATQNPYTNLWSVQIANNIDDVESAENREKEYDKLNKHLLANQDKKTKETYKFVNALREIYQKEGTLQDKQVQAEQLYTRTLSAFGKDETDIRNSITEMYQLWNKNFADETKNFAENLNSFINALSSLNEPLSNIVRECLSLISKGFQSTYDLNGNVYNSKYRSTSTSGNISTLQQKVSAIEGTGNITIINKNGSSATGSVSSVQNQLSKIEGSGNVTVVPKGAQGYLTSKDVSKFTHVKGTKGTTTSDFIAGENGPEIGILPNGTAVLYGANGPALYENQPLGTVIFPANKSSKLLSLHSNGTVNWDAYSKPMFLGDNGYQYPNYRTMIPEMTSTVNNGETITYDIHNVELPNVTDPQDFWKGLTEGVKRHMKDR